MNPPATVREQTYELLRRLGLTVVFGNPGSTEETFLKDFPGASPAGGGRPQRPLLPVQRPGALDYVSRREISHFPPNIVPENL